MSEKKLSISSARVGRVGVSITGNFRRRTNSSSSRKERERCKSKAKKERRRTSESKKAASLFHEIQTAISLSAFRLLLSIIFNFFSQIISANFLQCAFINLALPRIMKGQLSFYSNRLIRFVAFNMQIRYVIRPKSAKVTTLIKSRPR